MSSRDKALCLATGSTESKDAMFDCKLCRIVAEEGKGDKVQDCFLQESRDFVWVPGLGAFVEGYSLIISKGHMLNTGAMEEECVEELEQFVGLTSRSLEQMYGTDVIVCEHGSMGGTHKSGSCIDHQHLHLFPVNLSKLPLVFERKLEEIAEIGSLKDLMRLHEQRLPYLYIASQELGHHAYAAPILPRQYLRQVMAGELGVPEQWDWREHPLIQNITDFVDKARNRGYL